VDISLQWNVANIFERCPEELPDVANLKEFLKEPLAMKLPVFHSYSDQQNFEMSGVSNVFDGRKQYFKLRLQFLIENPQRIDYQYRIISW
jgi:hypothetical protein